MAADGSIVIDVVLDDGNVAQGVANINGQFDDLDNNGNSRLASVGAGIKKVASLAALGATAVVGIGAAIGGLVAPMVKAAADAQALNAQFDQVFGNLKDTATTNLNKIAKETGILPERLKGSFTMMAAFAKTSGSDTAAALNLTERATKAAADSAAFYDKSIEEVTESLQSYLKGNYENDSALGISSTETTRNAAANKLYKKSFNDLSEAQKQLTLLQMVEDGNKLSGALGQAARESDSLENQVGNLKQAWQNLKALLGGPILEPAVQGIMLLTKAIQSVDPAPFFAAFELIKKNVVVAIDYIKSYVQTGLQNLKTFWSEHGTNIINSVKTAFDNVLSVVQNILGIVVPFIQSQLSKIQQFWSENGSQILKAVSNAFNAIKAVIDFIMPAVKFLIETVWTAIKQVITGALDVIMGAVKIFSGLFTGDFGKMWEGIKQLFLGAIDLIIGWMTLSFVGGLKALLTNFAKAGWNIIKGMWDDIAKVFTNMGSKVSGFASETATKVVSYFTNLFNSAKGIFTNLRSTGESIWSALKQAVVNTAKSIWDNVVAKFNGLLNSARTIMTTVKTTITDLWSKAVDYIKSGVNLYEIGRNVIQGLINGIGSLASDVWEKVRSIASGITDTVKKTLDINSPSRVMRQIGLWTGEGLAIGLDDSSPIVNKAMSDIGDGILAVSKNYQKEYTNLIDEFNRKNEDKNDKTLEKIYKIQNNAAKKKRKLTQQEQQQIALLEASYRDNKMQSEINFQKKYQALVEKSEKEYLEVIKSYVADKKSLEELTLIDEARIWEQSMELFAEGTAERIRAQQEYKKAVDAVNKEITAINTEHANQVQKINEDLLKQEETLTKAYTDAVDKREQSLVSFKSLFEEFKAEIDVTGGELLTNLKSQVDGFKEWQKEVEKLSEKAIDGGLLEELRQMGPNALPQLRALNQLTEQQLQQYSALYKEKSVLAREQAESELIGMKNDTEIQIDNLRKAATAKLDTLNKEWNQKIKALTKTTSTELSSLQQVGVDAGKGLLEGLGSMQGPLEAKAKDIAEAITKTMQDVLDIHSPSRVMRDEVGKMIIAGIAAGMQDTSLLAKTMQDVTNDIIQSSKGLKTALGKDGIFDAFMKDIGIYKVTKQLDGMADYVDHYSDGFEDMVKHYNSAVSDMRTDRFENLQKEMDKFEGYTFNNLSTQEAVWKAFLKSVEVGSDDYVKAQARITQIQDQQWENSMELAYEYVKAQGWTVEMIENGAEDINGIARWMFENTYQEFNKMYDGITSRDDLFGNLTKNIETNHAAIIEYTNDSNKSIKQQMELVKESLKNDKWTLEERTKLEEIFVAKKKEAHNQLVSLEDAYTKKRQEAIQKRDEEVKRLTDIYETERQKIADTITSSIGLFDAIDSKADVTSQSLLNNLQSQVDYMSKWADNMAALSKRGISDGLLEEIKKMGIRAGDEIAALTAMSDEELEQYVKLWQQKNQIALGYAETELQDLKESTAAQIDAITQETATKLDEYKNEWVTQSNELKNLVLAEMYDLKDQMPATGVDAMKGLMSGMESMQGALINKAKDIADSIKSTIQEAFDIHSPSRWMRDFVVGNLAKGFNVGVDKNRGVFEGATAKINELIKPDASSIVNKLRGVKANIGLLHTPSSNANNQTTNNRYDQSKTMHNNFNIYGNQPDKNLERAMRRNQFGF